MVSASSHTTFGLGLSRPQWVYTSFHLINNVLNHLPFFFLTFKLFSYLHFMFTSNVLDFKENCPKPPVCVLWFASLTFISTMHFGLTPPSSSMPCTFYFFSCFSFSLRSFYHLVFYCVMMERVPSCDGCSGHIYHISVLRKFLVPIVTCIWFQSNGKQILEH